ncbi:MAG: hypothetical protein GY754_17860 [bacterium]|nr:hypothetical protein [bacterium]
MKGLEEALRLFEIHTNQVGVLVFVAEALASAFIVSHPDDYRALHQTVLEDFYGPFLYHYGIYGSRNLEVPEIDDSAVSEVSHLRGVLDSIEEQWASFQVFMANGILGREVEAQKVYTAGPFQLQRFITKLDTSRENHIGEAIARKDGTIEYLKTYRLSSAQTRRAYLLSQLAERNWNIEAAAASMKQSKDDLILRLEKAGFGILSILSFCSMPGNGNGLSVERVKEIIN